MNTNINEPIEQFWIQLGSITGSILAQLNSRELAELWSNLDTVSNTVSVAENITGEILARAMYWPKALTLSGEDMAFIGAHIGNMAALKGFLERLDDEIGDMGGREVGFAATPSHTTEPLDGDGND